MEEGPRDLPEPASDRSLPRHCYHQRGNFSMRQRCFTNCLSCTTYRQRARLMHNLMADHKGVQDWQN